MRKSMKNNFVEMLDNKRYYELNTNLKDMVKSIFPFVKSQDLIKCQLYKGKKVDLIIKINTVSKNVSLKSQNIICVYKGDIKTLLSFLFSIGISYRGVSAILSYQYSDGSLDGNGRRLESFGLLLEEDYKNEISIIKEEFNDDFKLIQLIDFILVKEKNGINVDYFYFGNLRKGEVISRDNLIKNILTIKKEGNNKFMKIGPFNLIPLSRCNNYIYNNENRHKCVLKINLFKYKK